MNSRITAIKKRLEAADAELADVWSHTIAAHHELQMHAREDIRSLIKAYEILEAALEFYGQPGGAWDALLMCPTRELLKDEGTSAREALKSARQALNGA